VHCELLGGASRLAIEARSSLHPIHVETREITGHLDAHMVDGEVVPHPGARMEVRVADLRSGNPLVDREARRRLDPRRHPTLVGELTSARRTARGVLGCEGEVTFQGRTCQVRGDLHVSLLGGGDLRLVGEQRVDVRRWGIEPPRLLALRVHPEVTVRLDLRAAVTSR
jgi:hypothetical protein